MYWKLLNNGRGMGRKEGVRENNGRGWAELNYNVLTAEIPWETPLNTDRGINNERLGCKIGSWGDTYGRRESEWRRWRWGNMVDGLHIHIQNRTMKPLAIVLSGVGKGLSR
jgi:hypothetical protein